jgi:hypothetical protein
MAGLLIVGMGIIANHEDDALSDRRSRAVDDLEDSEGYLSVGVIWPLFDQIRIYAPESCLHLALAAHIKQNILPAQPCNLT